MSPYKQIFPKVYIIGRRLKDENLQNPEYITHLKWKLSDNSSDESEERIFTVSEMIEYMNKNQQYRYYVYNEGLKREVIIVGAKPKYIKSKPDNKNIKDDLLDLPPC